MSALPVKIRSSRAKEVDKAVQSALERRQEILEVLCERRHETVENLATEFSVGERTIRRDIEYMSLSYPIYTTQGKGGGIYVDKDYRLGKKYLTDKQSEMLEELAKGLTGEKLAIMQSILKTFKEPRRKNEST